MFAVNTQLWQPWAHSPHAEHTLHYSEYGNRLSQVLKYPINFVWCILNGSSSSPKSELGVFAVTDAEVV